MSKCLESGRTAREDIECNRLWATWGTGVVAVISLRSIHYRPGFHQLFSTTLGRVVYQLAIVKSRDVGHFWQDIDLGREMGTVAQTFRAIRVICEACRRIVSSSIISMKLLSTKPDTHLT